MKKNKKPHHKPEQNHRQQNHEKFLQSLRTKGVGLALDFLRGCKVQQLKAVTARLAGGLHKAFLTLLDLGKKQLRRVEQIFGYHLGRICNNSGILEIDIEALPV